MIKVIVFVSILVAYVLSVTFFRKQVRLWYEDKQHVDPGMYDVMLMFIPILNVIAGSILMIDNYDKKPIRKFFGLK